jgi:hypothetical protein
VSASDHERVGGALGLSRFRWQKPFEISAGLSDGCRLQLQSVTFRVQGLDCGCILPVAPFDEQIECGLQSAADLFDHIRNLGVLCLLLNLCVHRFSPCAGYGTVLPLNCADLKLNAGHFRRIARRRVSLELPTQIKDFLLGSLLRL